MPFRSETESLREQLRRVEEQAKDLVDERTALEEQLTERRSVGSGRRRSLLVVAALLAIGATAVVGFVAGDLAADKHARRVRELREPRDAQEIAGILQTARDCTLLEEARRDELVACESERADAKRWSTMPLELPPMRDAPVPPRMGIPR